MLFNIFISGFAIATKVIAVSSVIIGVATVGFMLYYTYSLKNDIKSMDDETEYSQIEESDIYKEYKDNIEKETIIKQENDRNIAKRYLDDISIIKKIKDLVYLKKKLKTCPKACQEHVKNKCKESDKKYITPIIKSGLLSIITFSTSCFMIGFSEYMPGSTLFFMGGLIITVSSILFGVKTMIELYNGLDSMIRNRDEYRGFWMYEYNNRKKKVGVCFDD